MTAIGNLAEEHNLLILSDEVYDVMCLDDAKPHIRMASLANFWDRTVSFRFLLNRIHSLLTLFPYTLKVTVGSAGKAFAATGYRVGWVVGPAALITPTLAASTRIVFCANSIAQEACAVAIESAPKHQFFETQRLEYIERRKVIMEELDALGLPYSIPDGAYFVMLNTFVLPLYLSRSSSASPTFPR